MPFSSVVTPLLDHIVILIPHSFLTSPPEWFAGLFTFYPGGQHADGLTENTLALLQDGSYIEFIAFLPGVDPEERAKHKWGKQREGSVTDWALTLPGSLGEERGEQKKLFHEIQEAVKKTQTGIGYADLVPGGRHRPDGELLRWAVAGAYRSKSGGIEAFEPGLLPFWCIDDTKRELRVPYLQGGVAKHPTGAVGVALVSVTPNGQKEAEKLDKVYDAVLGEGASSDDSLWDLKTLLGDRVHVGGQFRLEAASNATSVSIAFFTNSDNFAGRKLGGNVTDGVNLEFEFILAGL